MITEIRYTNINRILDDIQRHPLMNDITLEQAIAYVIEFIGIFGMPKFYQDKEASIDIEDYRGFLPCDLISVIQVKDNDSQKCMRSSTDNFMPKEDPNVLESHGGIIINPEFTFKVQGSVIITSIKNGSVTISYKSLPIDGNGFPLLIDNPVFLKALQAYIKKEYFTVLFDLGKITQQSLQNAQQSYGWLAGQLRSEFTIPSISEMESITRMWTTMLQRNTEFDRGFKTLGDREYLRTH